MNIETAKYIKTMPDGSKWAIPVLVIAKHRAKVYADEFGDDESRSLAEDTKPLFESSDYEIADWAYNNMNWDDVKEHAVKVQDSPPVDFQKGWISGAFSVK